MSLIFVPRGGDPGDTVNITSRSILNETSDTIGYSGVKLGSDGVLSIRHVNGGWSAIGGEWLNRGTPGTFYVSMTLDAGTLTEDDGAGPLQLNADRIYSITQTGSGIKNTTITLDISDDVSGTPIVDTAQYFLEVNVGPL